MSETTLYHYKNTSVMPKQGYAITKDYYDGMSFWLPAGDTGILVPCCSDDPHHVKPSEECIVVTQSNFVSATEDVPLTVFSLHNTTDFDLLIKPGHVLGENYPAPHDRMRARRGYITLSSYLDLIEYCTGQEIDEDLCMFPFFPTPPPSPV